MSTTIVTTPPLSQSRFEQMGCEHSYALVHIAGLRPPSTPPAVRGTEVHEALADYVAHCAAKRVKSDYAYMDLICHKVGDESAGILQTARDSIVVDWANFFCAEVSMGLDDEFQPTYSVNHDCQDVPISDVWGYPGTGKPPAYCGVVDAIYLFNGGRAAKIVDYKTMPRPFEPTTFQGKEYALFLFMHLPELQEIEFVLQFVRFPNIYKPAKYLRSDVPQMMEECRRVRAHQREIHQRVAEAVLDKRERIGSPAAIKAADLTVHAGKQCTYCPAILDNSCPLGELNPMTNMSPVDRLNFRLWADAANRANNQAMKDYVDGTGQTISSKDANGKRYTYGPTLTTSTTYPLFLWNKNAGFELNPVVEKLLDWITYTMPEDGQATKKGLPPWPARLRIGSTEFTTPLKAGKRADLHQWMQDTPGVIVKTDEVEMKLQRDAEVDDGTGSEYRDYSQKSDDGF